MISNINYPFKQLFAYLKVMIVGFSPIKFRVILRFVWYPGFANICLKIRITIISVYSCIFCAIMNFVCIMFYISHVTVVNMFDWSVTLNN